MFFADAELGNRLEAMSAAELCSYVEISKRLFPGVPVDELEIGGGVGAWLGPGSPVNQMVGLGFSGEVTEADASKIEQFYANRQQRAVVTVCPLADLSLTRVLGWRGWTASGFQNVLAREVGEPQVVEGDIEMRIVGEDDDDALALWAQVMTYAFSAPQTPTPAETRLGKVVAARPGSIRLLAYLEDRPIGTGELHIDGDIAWLSADATLASARGRGVQSALQLERLRLAAEAGCKLAVTESAPGSGSQRNQERNGFHVVYTRVDLRAPDSLELLD